MEATTKHWIVIMAVCLGIGGVIGAIYYLDLSSSNLVWLLLLLCPIMHYFMMKKHKHKET